MVIKMSPQMSNKRSQITIGTLALLITILGCSKKPTKTPDVEKTKAVSFHKNESDEQQRKGRMMTSNLILEAIRSKDWTITEKELSIDPVLGPKLVSILDDDDPEVRELALYALNNIGGKEVRHGILKALRDKNINVRSTASRFLMAKYDKEDLHLYLQELSTNEDELVREKIALIIGKIGDQHTIDPLKLQIEKEIDSHAQRAMYLALVKLKEKEAQDKYRNSLIQKPPKELAIALNDYIYINDHVFVPNILPLLEDTRDAVNVAPSNHVHFIRVCDVAVNILDEALEHPFSFKLEEGKRYSIEERNEVKNIIKDIK